MSMRSLPATWRMAFCLGRTTHTRDRNTDVHCRADAGVEQVIDQVDLPVGNGDDIGGDIG